MRKYPYEIEKPDYVSPRDTPRGREPEREIAPPSPEEALKTRALIEVIPVEAQAVSVTEARARPSDDEIWNRIKDSPRVRRALFNKRYERAGLSLLESKGEEPSDRGFYFVFVYNDLNPLQIEVNLAKGEVVDIRNADYQPALTPAEERRAITLARRDHVIATMPGAGNLEPRVLGSQSEQEGADQGERRRHLRQAQVSFFAQLERLPRAIVVVDLAENRVLTSHRMDEIIADISTDEDEDHHTATASTGAR